MNAPWRDKYAMRRWLYAMRKKWYVPPKRNSVHDRDSYGLTTRSIKLFSTSHQNIQRGSVLRNQSFCDWMICWCITQRLTNFPSGRRKIAMECAWSFWRVQPQSLVCKPGRFTTKQSTATGNRWYSALGPLQDVSWGWLIEKLTTVHIVCLASNPSSRHLTPQSWFLVWHALCRLDELQPIESAWNTGMHFKKSIDWQK